MSASGRHHLVSRFPQRLDGQTVSAESTEIRPASGHPLSLRSLKKVAGGELRPRDLDSMERALGAFTRINAVFEKNFGPAKNRYIVVAEKHGVMVGASVKEATDEASEKVRDRAIRRAIEGALRHSAEESLNGTIVTNFPLREFEARLLTTWPREQGQRTYRMVLAPYFDSDAVSLFSRQRGQCLMYESEAFAASPMPLSGPKYRSRIGELVREDVDVMVPCFENRRDELRSWGPSEWLERPSVKRDMSLAWAVGSGARSFSITITHDGEVAGNTEGQTTMGIAARVALDKLVKLNRTAPYTDLTAYTSHLPDILFGLETMKKDGITAILTHQGELKAMDIAQQAAQRNLAFVMLPDEYRVAD